MTLSAHMTLKVLISDRTLDSPQAAGGDFSESQRSPSQRAEPRQGRATTQPSSLSTQAWPAFFIYASPVFSQQGQRPAPWGQNRGGRQRLRELGGGWSNHPVSLCAEGPVDTISSVGAALLKSGGAWGGRSCVNQVTSSPPGVTDEDGVSCI